jgi:hypothetical protein
MVVYPYPGGLSSLVSESKVAEEQDMRKIVTGSYSRALFLTGLPKDIAEWNLVSEKMCGRRACPVGV